MASTESHSSFPVERIPYLVLDHICSYLDDEDEDRYDLWAFSLTCRRFCGAADKRRFCQIVVSITSVDALGDAVDQLRAVLSHDRRFRFVQRLRLQGMLDEHALERKKTKSPPFLDRYYSDPVHQTERQYEAFQPMTGPHSIFDTLHPFCTLEGRKPEYKDDEQQDDEGNDADNSKNGLPNRDRIEAWQKFADLIDDLPALRDLLWTGAYVPRVVLDAVHTPRKRLCRLHISGNRFHLRSLIYARDHPQTISADDLALISSPSLYSISASLSLFDTKGNLDYTDHGIERMMGGLAPNLTNVWLQNKRASVTDVVMEAYRLGRPEWGGLFHGDVAVTIKEQYAKAVSAKRSSVECLQIDRDVSVHKYSNWDLSKLRRLCLAWSHSAGAGMVDYAERGQLASLETLSLTTALHLMEPAGTQEAMRDFFSHIGPLNHLRLVGCFTDLVYTAVIRHHGKTLKSLYAFAYGNYDMDLGAAPDAPRQLFRWSVAAVEDLVEMSSPLEAFMVEMDRTRGDRKEVAMYRALSKLPRLRYLMISHTVGTDLGPDEERRDEIFTCEDKKLLAYANKATFTNAAIDGELARSIFDLISRNSQGTLKALYIRPLMNEPVYDSSFNTVISALALHWTVFRNPSGAVTVSMDHEYSTVLSFRECLQMERSNRNGGPEEREYYPDVFAELWPDKKHPNWWVGWTSLPLDLSEEL